MVVEMRTMRRRGFTIIEVLLVVTLIAMASVVVSYEVYGRLDKTSLWSSSQKLLRAARFAGLLAGEYHVVCRLHIDRDARTYWLSVQPSRHPLDPVDGDDAAAETSPKRPVVDNPYEQATALPDGLRFGRVLLEGGSDRERGELAITFDMDGSSEAAVVQIAGEEETHSLLIYPWTSRCRLVGRAVEELPVDTVRSDASGGGEGWL